MGQNTVASEWSESSPEAFLVADTTMRCQGQLTLGLSVEASEWVTSSAFEEKPAALKMLLTRILIVLSAAFSCHGF